MNDRKFPHNDPLFNEVVDAADALHKLNVSIHYLSCGKTGSHTYQRRLALQMLSRSYHPSHTVSPSTTVESVVAMGVSRRRQKT